MTKLPAIELNRGLDQFQGGGDQYRHWMPGVRFTEGVKWLCDNAGAYWLVDAIASHLISGPYRLAAKRDARLAGCSFWRLQREPKGQGAHLYGEADSGEEPAIHQAIEFTDFPLPSVRIWAEHDGTEWVLLLPSEH